MEARGTRLFGEASPKSYGDRYQDHLLDQYKVYVEFMDRTRQRRISASSSDVLLVVNTLLAATAAAGATGIGFGIDTLPTIVIGVVGLIVCLAWAQRINAYRSLAVAQFQVIHQIEKRLPLQLYEEEWHVLNLADKRRSYRPTISLELLMPRLFALLHVILIAVAII
jgi:hypothetical protein